MIELSIIIVNYKTPVLVIDCLRTVYAQTSAVEFEIIIVDNASGDNSRETIMAMFPAVKWIQMEYNAGFARANNAAIRQSAGNMFLLLNSDTLIEERAIENCYQKLMSSAYVAAGVQLLNFDRSSQISGNYFMKGGLNYLLPLPYLGNLLKRVGQLLHVAKPNVPDAKSLIEVDWVNGAFLMVKRSAVDQSGLMDEDFFLYAEEAEWCSRLRHFGKIVVYGELHVVHLQGGTTNDTFQSSGHGYYNLYDLKGRQIMVSTFVRLRKQFGIGWFLLQLVVYILEIPLFAAGVLFSKLRQKGKRRYTTLQLRQYCRNLAFVIGKTPKIARNTPYFYKVL